MAYSLNLLFALADEIEISKSETLRYMGCNNKSLSSNMEELYSLCLDKFKKAVSYKACFSKTKVCFKGNGMIDFDFGTVQSFHLEKNLEGCDEAYIFAATCGIAVDRLVMRLEKTDPSKSVFLDAMGSAATEDFCDYLNEKLAKEHQLKPRFSCGYGDFKIENQKLILDFLDAYRKIGITLSESFMMTPKKTVTAVVGIKRKV